MYNKELKVLIVQELFYLDLHDFAEHMKKVTDYGLPQISEDIRPILISLLFWILITLAYFYD